MVETHPGAPRPLSLRPQPSQGGDFQVLTPRGDACHQTSSPWTMGDFRGVYSRTYRLEQIDWLGWQLTYATIKTPCRLERAQTGPSRHRFPRVCLPCLINPRMQSSSRESRVDVECDPR